MEGTELKDSGSVGKSNELSGNTPVLPGAWVFT